MPTNDERREAARKLRDIGYLGNFDDVVKAIGFPNDMTWRMDEFNARLADLIDPDTIPDNPDETGRPLSDPEIDRDALLALADEIDRKSDDGTVNPDPTKPLASSLDLFGYARRIREAVGA